MPRLARRLVAAPLLSLILAVPAIVPIEGTADAALRDGERARRAIGFIAAQQNANGSIPAFSPIGSTADAVLAIVAAGTGRPALRSALGYLSRQVARGNVVGIGLRSKVVLAFAAAGMPTTDIGGENLVHDIRSAYRDGLSPIVFDTALAVLALEAAGASVPPAATDFLLDNRCPDGGWPYDAYDAAAEDDHCSAGAGDFYLSDTNSTALAVMALEAEATVARRGSGVAASFDFFAAIRDDLYGGWGYTWGFETTDANSTALVIQAHVAAGRRIPDGAKDALRSLQYARCGAFAFTFTDGARTDPDIGATIGAVPGLLGLAMPFVGSVEGAAPETPSCGG